MARFADTSYFLALLIPNDENHSAAFALARESHKEQVTTDWVLTEVANHLASSRSRGVFIRFLRAIEKDSQMIVVEASRELMQNGLTLYESRLDKNWSLTDCVSFVVMRERHLTEALTADHHFEQAGFTRLLK